jgi:hypothetical protein
VLTDLRPTIRVGRLLARRRESAWLAVLLVAIWALVGVIPLSACLLGACDAGCSMHGRAMATPTECTRLSDQGPLHSHSELGSVGCTCGRVDVSARATFQPSQDATARYQASACAVLPSALSVSQTSPGILYRESTQRTPQSVTKDAPGARAPPSA